MCLRKYQVVVVLLIAATAMVMQSCKEEKHYHDYFDKSQLKYIAKLGNKPKLEDNHLQGDTAWVDNDSLHRIATSPLPGSFEDLFMDYNDVQIPHATSNGIEPIENLHDAYHLRQPLVKIAT